MYVPTVRYGIVSDVPVGMYKQYGTVGTYVRYLMDAPYRRYGTYRYSHTVGMVPTYVSDFAQYIPTVPYQPNICTVLRVRHRT